MSQAVIQVENLSKLYRLGEVSTGTLSHDLKRWWHRLRGKEDPYTKVGVTNDRSQAHGSEWVWALKDINFEVKEGEVLGVIGRNGAGKSTLLKILSRVTSPSSGRIKTKGRIASLLEVGTGFHPELTGRENIYLNGAILGMRRHEITRKLDEIVDFSGCAAYLDTPVKRYSSGMYVRLAFAVAAHLEPEILVVDEVLAVGDAEFQRKCLGKIKDVASNQGRTVLLVSHNTAAIRRISTLALIMDKGTVGYVGFPQKAIDIYLGLNESNFRPKSIHGRGLTIHSVEVRNCNNKESAELGNDEPIQIIISGENTDTLDDLNISLQLLNAEGQVALHTASSLGWPDEKSKIGRIGTWTLNCTLPAGVLNPGSFSLAVGAEIPFVELLIPVTVANTFKVRLTSKAMSRHPESAWKGILGSEIALWKAENAHPK